MPQRYVTEKEVDSSFSNLGPQLAIFWLREAQERLALCEAVHADHHHYPSVLRGAKFSARSVGFFRWNGD